MTQRSICSARGWVLTVVGLPTLLCVMGHVSPVASLSASQTSDNREKAFLVTSVKRSDIQRPAMLSIAPNRLTLPGITVRGLLKIAYRRPLPHQIDGGPHWIDSEYFDVEGTFPPDTPFDDYALMLQTLLRDRFKLSATVVTKELSAEALVVRRSDRQLGSRLRSSNVDCASVDLSKTITTRPGEPRLCALVTGPARSQAGFRIVTMYGRSVGMPRLADYLSGARQKPVVDQTALAGVFDFDLEFLSESGAGGIEATENTPRLPIALQEQLGLALRATRAPIEVLQIERVEPPTPN